MIVQVIGWVTAVVVIASWFYASWKHRYRQFDYVNVVSSVILVPVYLVEGASFGAFLSLAYGIASVVSLVKHWVSR